MDTISRDSLVRAVNILGWDPHDVHEVTITPDLVTVQLFERDDHGNKILTTDEEGHRGAALRIEQANVR